MSTPLTDELVSLVIPPLTGGAWLHQKNGRVIFALRLGGGGYLIGCDGVPSVIAHDTDALIRVAEEFITSL